MTSTHLISLKNTSCQSKELLNPEKSRNEYRKTINHRTTKKISDKGSDTKNKKKNIIVNCTYTIPYYMLSLRLRSSPGI